MTNKAPWQEKEMDGKVELQWRLLKENRDYARHHDLLRASATNIVITVAGASFAVVGFDKCISITDFPLLIFAFAFIVVWAVTDRCA